MARYDFQCPKCGLIEIAAKMTEVKETMDCPKCGNPIRRIYQPVPDVWHTDGAHKTDYGSGNTVGTKRDALNKAWSKAWGEEPPPPAADVPANSSEKY